ncbi:hypothetical protein [Streptomyces sp. WAC 06783]|uniref:hypothetical protein n=1 Tax=Streptomyces sp. WAC 06783 TaxID=2203211 RepID=UPI000F74B2AB|nr:hypothetical protein [Streptomyces sp. WAC 06783]
MNDAFTLLRHATGLLPTGARTTSGATVEDVHDNWELVLHLLLEFGEEHPVPRPSDRSSRTPRASSG